MSYRPKYNNGIDLPVDCETIKTRTLNTTAISNTGTSADNVNDTNVPTSKVVKDYVDAVRDNLKATLITTKTLTVTVTNYHNEFLYLLLQAGYTFTGMLASDTDTLFTVTVIGRYIEDPEDWIYEFYKPDGTQITSGNLTLYYRG